MVVKRALDCTLALLGLLLLSPLLVLVAIAVKLDSEGPVLYRAERVGRHGELFAMFKFRTMVEGPAGDGPRVTASDDPRITRLGRLLRDTKINELPQLINVLLGDMSLVGPRPEDPEFVTYYSSEERQVLSVLPGITSPAAVLYCNEEALLSYATAADAYIHQILPAKLRLDLRYVRRRSLLLDLDVLLRTFLALLPLFGRAMPEAAQVFCGPIQRLALSDVPWFAIDGLTAFGGVSVAGLIWRASGPLDIGWGHSFVLGLEMAFAFSATNYILGVQRTAWHCASAPECIDLAASTSVATLGVLVGHRFLLSTRSLPTGMILLSGFFALSGYLATRYHDRFVAAVRVRWLRLWGGGPAGRERVLVIGGGEAGQSLVRLLQYGAGARAFEVVGIIDDDLWKTGSRIHQVEVIGDRSHIVDAVKAHSVGLIVFAIHNIDAVERKAVLRICRSTPARVVLMPDMVGLLRQVAGSARQSAGTRPASASGSPQPALVPAMMVGDRTGLFLHSESVMHWVDELGELAAQGQMAEVVRRVEEMRLLIGCDGAEAPEAPKARRTASALTTPALSKR